MKIYLWRYVVPIVMLTGTFYLGFHVAKLPGFRLIKKRWAVFLGASLLVGFFLFIGISTNLMVIGYGFYLLLFFLLTDLIHLLLRVFSRDRRVEKVWRKINCNGILVLVAALLVCLIGYYQAKHKVITKYSIELHKDMKNNEDLRIVFFSDVHLGTAVEIEDLEEIKQMTENLRPDLVCLIGDIYDENTIVEEMEQSFRILGSLNSSYGTYYVFGNHDKGGYNSQLGEDRIRKGLTRAGIYVMEDEKLLINNSFYLVGRQDAGRNTTEGRQPMEELLKDMDDSYPVFLLDHQPVGLQGEAKAGVDLQFSGHTHNAQLFPLNLLTEPLKMNEWDYGWKQIEDYQVIVSSGIGTWGFPLRTAGKAEIVCVDIRNTGE